MASFKLPFFLFISSLFLHASLAEVVCEDLPPDVCAFSISSSGKRCLLETTLDKNDEVEYQCRTSEVMVERMAEHIESDECVSACGVDRNDVGISSDALLEPEFTNKLCSPACSHNCPNIVDLFFNLAAGEGVFLPELCEALRINPRRSMAEFISSSGEAFGPGPSEAELFEEEAPAPAPAIESESESDSDSDSDSLE
ncbi:hypothetical protein like AT3G54040 [Hibiscus trionum]|uniref:PAR1 protein n=1 Tax=Hibiscus trionum TaxID=183268 RepID=A0A9W7MUK1_HIBTR|nr:hypothetical protein like AT3G54040 [Hibiscus trionum]